LSFGISSRAPHDVGAVAEVLETSPSQNAELLPGFQPVMGS
jgi:hypothetical protein